MGALYPIFLDLTGRNVLVVGAGAVAARKVSGLLRAGARVSVVAPEVCEALDAKEREGSVRILRRPYRASDLEGCWLVVAATDEPELNGAVSEDAAGARLFCNVVDQPALCSFQVPAVVRRGLLQIAVSTGGASPALARRIRLALEEVYGPAYGQLLDALLGLRAHFQRKYPQDQQQRQRLLESFIDSSAPDLLLRDGDTQAFLVELERWQSR